MLANPAVVVFSGRLPAAPLFLCCWACALCGLAGAATENRFFGFFSRHILAANRVDSECDFDDLYQGQVTAGGDCYHDDDCQDEDFSCEHEDDRVTAKGKCEGAPRDGDDCLNGYPECAELHY